MNNWDFQQSLPLKSIETCMPGEAGKLKYPDSEKEHRSWIVNVPVNAHESITSQ